MIARQSFRHEIWTRLKIQAPCVRISKSRRKKTTYTWLVIIKYLAGVCLHLWLVINSSQQNYFQVLEGSEHRSKNLKKTIFKEDDFDICTNKSTRSRNFYAVVLFIKSSHHILRKLVVLLTKTFFFFKCVDGTFVLIKCIRTAEYPYKNSHWWNLCAFTLSAFELIIARLCFRK